MILYALRYSVQGVRWRAGPFIVLTTVAKCIVHSLNRFHEKPGAARARIAVQCHRRVYQAEPAC